MLKPGFSSGHVWSLEMSQYRSSNRFLSAPINFSTFPERRINRIKIERAETSRVSFPRGWGKGDVVGIRQKKGHFFPTGRDKYGVTRKHHPPVGPKQNSTSREVATQPVNGDSSENILRFAHPELDP